MNRLILSTTLCAAVAGVFGLAGEAYAQAGGAESAAPALPHKVGLIDMAHVFKQYKKFEALREDLKAEITASEEKAKQIAITATDIQKEMRQLKEGSPEYLTREKEIAKLSSDLETFKKVAQRDFLRKESQIYKTVYMEVSDAVTKYAQFYKYTLVIRFNRDGLETADQPPDVLQKMNKQVIYYREEDDITLSVLDYLNRRYKPSPSPSPTPAGTAGKPTPARN